MNMMKFVLPSALAIATGLVPAAAQEPLATLNGTPIHASDLNVTADQRKLEQQLYTERKGALDAVIRGRLLEAEADRRELTVAELVEAEVVPKVGEPTNKEINDFYQQQRDKIQKPLKEVRDQLVELMRQTKYRLHLADYLASLAAAADIKIHLDPPRLPVDLTDVRVRGPADAPVTIVEFSDFQCPYCRQVQPTLVELQEEYKDQVRWIFKDLPLNEIHPEAARAAQAARCAGEQGEFWPFRAKLFEQELFVDSMYSGLADELKIDSEKLLACLESARHEEAVAKEAQEARSLGIDGTPAFLLNGILITGAQPADAFRELIDRELERTKTP